MFISAKIGYVQAAKAVLPHGVLEIPAVIFAAAYGLSAILYLGSLPTRGLPSNFKPC
jgi:uncharacterized membrane protein SpoIIM required for sporulation